MLNIIKYNLYRACKSKTVYALLAVCVLFGVVGTVVAQKLDSGNYDLSLLIISFTVPALIYADYKDGLARNKIMTDCSRGGNYAANFISSSIVGAGFWLLFQGTSIGVMNIMGNHVLFTGMHALVFLGAGLIAVIALCALFTAVAVNVRSHFSLIICIALYVILMLVGSFLMNLSIKPTLNPQLRGFIIALVKLSPTGQLTYLQDPSVTNAWVYPLLSMAFTAVITFIGAALFVKKDLK